MLDMDLIRKIEKFFEQVRVPKPSSVEKCMNTHLTYLGQGCYREVRNFNDDWVMKFPTSRWAMVQNLIEFMLSKQYPDYFPFCFLFVLDGVPFNVSERVRRDVDHRPIFSSTIIEDGFYQCGFTKTMRFVCYDAGSEMQLLHDDIDNILRTISQAAPVSNFCQMEKMIKEVWKEEEPKLPIIPYDKMIPFNEFSK
jgi:hypothetical protein